MGPPDDLINKGFIVNRHTVESGRTFIVTGLQRSGTSLVAAMLRQAGLFIGSEINDAVFEDEAIARCLDARDIPALRQIIAARNATFPTWGFKFPTLCEALEPGQLALFDRPRVIVTFRDPVAMAVRRSVSEYREPMQALAEVAADQTAMLAFVCALPCPSLLVSYEKALMSPEDFVDALIRFCDMPQSADLRRRLSALIEPNNRQYASVARTRFEGLIEGVRDGQLYGWCRLAHSTDPLTLDVLIDDRAAMRIVAETFRQDLLDAGIGQGRHGFFIDLAALRARPEAVVRIAVAPYGIELDNSGTRLCDFGSAA
jgi:hypothetical protein